MGACDACDGLGTKKIIDPEMIIPNPNLSIRAGAIAAWKTRYAGFHAQTVETLSEHYKFDIQTPWKDLSQKARDVVLYGSGEEKIDFAYNMETGSYNVTKVYEGVIPNLQRRYKETESEDFREDTEKKYLSLIHI